MSGLACQLRVVHPRGALQRENWRTQCALLTRLDNSRPSYSVCRDFRRCRSYRPCVSKRLRDIWRRREQEYFLRRELRKIFEEKVNRLTTLGSGDVTSSISVAVATESKPTTITSCNDLSKCTIVSARYDNKGLVRRDAKEPTGGVRVTEDVPQLDTNAPPTSIGSSTIPLQGDGPIPIVKGTSFLGALSLLQSLAATTADKHTAAASDQGDLTPLITLRVSTNIVTTHQALRGTVDLPHSCSSPTRLLVFCPDEMAPEVLAYGADYAGETELISKVTNGFLGFDKCLTTPDFMPKIMRLARILGPKQLFPNPRAGTIVLNLKVAVEKIKSGASLTFRAADDGSITVPIGRLSMPSAHIVANAAALSAEILRQRELTVRVSNVKKSSAAPARPTCKKKQLRKPLSTPSLYFNTLDFKSLLQLPLAPYKKFRTSSLTAAKQKENGPEVLKSCITGGLLMIDGIPAIPVHGNGLVATQSGFTSIWPFRDMFPNADTSMSASL